MFIRTKDGRISYVDYEPNEEVPYYGVITNKGRETCYNIEDVVKPANTIEELCDEFVIVNNADALPFRINVHEQWFTEVQKSRVPLIPLSIMTFDYAKERFERLKEFFGTKEIHDKYANCLYEKNPNFVFDGTIKGAIWTNKGLIYVAKMNKKGKLELL